VPLAEILVMQGIKHSQLHVLNPSALQGMTITTQCFFFSLPVWKNIFVNFWMSLKSLYKIIPNTSSSQRSSIKKPQPSQAFYC